MKVIQTNRKKNCSQQEYECATKNRSNVNIKRRRDSQQPTTRASECVSKCKSALWWRLDYWLVNKEVSWQYDMFSHTHVLPARLHFHRCHSIHDCSLYHSSLFFFFFSLLSPSVPCCWLFLFLISTVLPLFNHFTVSTTSLLILSPVHDCVSF